MATPQWIDVSQLSFNVLMRLEDPHLKWFPRDWPGNELGIAFKNNGAVYDYFRARMPRDHAWLDEMVDKAGDADPDRVRECEIAVMKRICDWIVYVWCPEEYDKQPFVKWDNEELLGLADFGGKVIADVGSGTGRLLEPVVANAKRAYAIEPIGNLRRFLKSKFSRHSSKLFALDGLITEIPLPDETCDILLSGHVYGDAPEAELREMERVAKADGMVILCPGNSDVDNDAHKTLVAGGYQWSTFVEPGEGAKRKYWRRLS
jgi:SAM-dependent methyltransferase